MIDKPVLLNSDLKDEYIIQLAQFLASVRAEVIELHDETNLGDTPLALGTRAYECCRTRLISQDNKNVWSWFSILTPDQRFTFTIGNTPVRFARIEANSLPYKKLIRSYEALHQFDMFAEELPDISVHWFIVFDTDYLSPADSVYFVGYNDQKEIICKWEIPMEENIISLSNVNSPLPEAINIEKARLKLRNKTKTIKEKKNEK